MKTLLLGIIAIAGIGMFTIIFLPNVYAPCVIGPTSASLCVGSDFSGSMDKTNYEKTESPLWADGKMSDDEFVNVLKYLNFNFETYSMPGIVSQK